MKRLAVLFAVALAVALFPVTASASASQASVSSACQTISGVRTIVSTVNYAGTGIADGTVVQQHEDAWAQYVNYLGHSTIIRSHAIDRTATVSNGFATFYVASSLAPANAGNPSGPVTGRPFVFGLIPSGDYVVVAYQAVAGVCS